MNNIDDLCYRNKEFSGHEFNSLFPSNKFYKITNEEEMHHGLQYRDGIVTDINKFDPTAECNGGIYFSDIKYIHLYFCYGVYIRRVRIPSDARVCIESRKIKTSKICLEEKLPIEEFKLLKDVNYCKMIVNEKLPTYKYIKYMPTDFHKSVVMSHSSALAHIHTQTNELCEYAVACNGLSLKYVKIQTPKICEIAVSNNGLALKYVEIQTHAICEIAVSNNGMALEFVHRQTPTICEIAVRQRISSYKFVKEENKTLELNKLLVSLNPYVALFLEKFMSIERATELLAD